MAIILLKNDIKILKCFTSEELFYDISTADK